MPIHDWTRARANCFHDFRLNWIVQISRTLNTGLLPDGYYSLAERPSKSCHPSAAFLPYHPMPAGARSLADDPIQTRHQSRADTESIRYARKADRIVIRRPDDIVVALIEIVSPGNKSSGHAARSFASKAARFLLDGIHLLIVDLFPPSRRDPQGIHKLIWDRIVDEPFALPADQPLTLAAYSAGEDIRAFVEPVAVGDRLPEMPIFLEEDHYVRCPLEATYQASWNVFPRALRGPLEGTSTS